MLREQQLNLLEVFDRIAVLLGPVMVEPGIPRRVRIARPQTVSGLALTERTVATNHRGEPRGEPWQVAGVGPRDKEMKSWGWGPTTK